MLRLAPTRGSVDASLFHAKARSREEGQPPGAAGAILTLEWRFAPKENPTSRLRGFAASREKSERIHAHERLRIARASW
jgi:hypothetical protein